MRSKSNKLSCDWQIPAELKTVGVNNYEMAYLDQGDGIPLVWVHGSLSDYRSWKAQVDFFSHKYRTITLSLRHCYPEIWNGVGDDFTIRQHSGDLTEFIKNLKIGPVHIVGHSRGGAVVLKAVTVHPYLFRTAVLADPIPLSGFLQIDSEISAELKKRDNVVRRVLDLIDKGDLDNGLKLFTDLVGTSGTWDKLSATDKQIRRDNAWSLKSLTADVKEPLNYREVKNVDIPILLISAENSPLIYKIMHDRLECCLKNYQKVIIKKASHGMHRDNPESFNSVILNFLMDTK